jgi:hypothetical protein
MQVLHGVSCAMPYICSAAIYFKGDSDTEQSLTHPEELVELEATAVT